MTIMVQEVGAYISWVGMLVHMMKSKIVGINLRTGERVATDNITLHGVKITVIAICSKFRYSAGLVDWIKSELDSISKMWAQAY